MKIGDEVFVRGYVDEIRKDCIIIRNDGGYFGTVPSEVFCYEEDRNGYGTLNEADTPQTEKRTDRDGDVWEWRGDAWYCIGQPDTPQTEAWKEPFETDCSWK